MPEGRVSGHLPPESSNGHARAGDAEPKPRSAATSGSMATSNRGFSIGVPEFVYKIVRALARCFASGYFRVKIEGAEKIPARGAAILAPVHRSFIDFLIVGTTITKRKAFFMAKDDLWKSQAHSAAFLETPSAHSR